MNAILNKCQHVSCLILILLLMVIEARAQDVRVLRNQQGAATFAVIAKEGSSLGQLKKNTQEGVRAWLAEADPIYVLNERTDRSRPLDVQLKFDRVIPAGKIEIVRFHQFYRGIPIVGSGATISVARTTTGEVVTFSGPIVDSNVDLEAWNARLKPALNLLPAQDRARAQLVVLAEQGIYAYRVEDQPGGIGEPEERFFHAATGKEVLRRSLSAQSSFDHATLNLVMAHQQTNNPGTTGIVGFAGLRGSTYGKPIFSNIRLRMGDERLIVYDMQLHNELPAVVPTTWLFSPGTSSPYGIFGNADPNSFVFRTQDAFVRASKALSYLDPVMSPFGWDHDPASPFGIFTAAPLTLIANVDGTPDAADSEPDFCHGGLGATALATFGGWGDTREHPYPTNAYRQSAIVLCSPNLGVIFHELGHYIDDHSTYSILGTGVTTNTCRWDTPDEGHALRETVADMFGLYLTRKLYPALPYTLSTASPACNFQSIGRGSFLVHDPACMSKPQEAGWFDNDRPHASLSQACMPTQGYRLRSVVQASWAYLHGKLCLREAPYTCGLSFVTPSADHFAEAMIYALHLTNQHSYKSFFQSMWVYLWANYSNKEYTRFRAIFANYGLLDS